MKERFRGMHTRTMGIGMESLYSLNAQKDRGEVFVPVPQLVTIHAHEPE